MEEQKNKNLGGAICGLVIFGIISLGGMCSSGSRSTDGVFESATKKIDQGRAAELTKEEKQRLDDIINFCNICGTARRLCRHGR